MGVCVHISTCFRTKSIKSNKRKKAYAQFLYQRGQLLFQDEFDTFDTNIWEVCNR